MTSAAHRRAIPIPVSVPVPLPVADPSATASGVALRPRDRGGRPSHVLAVWFRQELVLLLREPVAVFFSLAFPLIIYVFIGIPFADEEVDGVRYIDIMFPALIGTVCANLLIMGLPIYLSELRTRQTLRRYRVLPLPGWVLAGAILLAMLTLVAAASALVVVVIGVQHGLLAGALSWRFLLVMAGLIAWLSAVGLLLGALPVGARTVQALCAAIFFVMFFGSGGAVPLDSLPAALRGALEWNPLKQWFDVLIGLYTDTGVRTGEWLRLLVAAPLAAGSTWLGLRLLRRS